MSKLNHQTIKGLAKLCRIECKDDEAEALLEDLKRILEYIEQLQELDTSEVEPCNHVLESMVNVTRKDEIGAVLSRETFLANAPSHTGGMIRVPSVIKQHS